jgi:hypothetical protein
MADKFARFSRRQSNICFRAHDASTEDTPQVLWTLGARSGKEVQFCRLIPGTDAASRPPGELY